MKKTFLLVTTAFLLPMMVQAESTTPKAPAAKPAAMQDMKGKMGGGMMARKEMTLEDARKMAHEKADRLDKMTPEEWKEHQARKMAFWDKVNKMTPEERDKFFKERHAKFEKMKGQNGGMGGMSSSGGMMGGGDMKGGAEVPGGHE